MKKMMNLAMLMTIAITANAMPYTQAKNEALFLSDKMAYELNLTVAQYDAVYEINLDYMMSVGNASDAYGSWWTRRNTDLQYVLTAYQYNKYMERSYFYRPLTWKAGSWEFNIYSHYTNRSHFYKARPTVYVSYRGGNNKKANTYYADRRVTKPTPASKTRSTRRVTDNSKRNTTPATSDRNGNSHSHPLAQNTSKNSHFGGHR